MVVSYGCCDVVERQRKRGIAMVKSETVNNQEKEGVR